MLLPASLFWWDDDLVLGHHRPAVAAQGGNEGL